LTEGWYDPALIHDPAAKLAEILDPLACFEVGAAPAISGNAQAEEIAALPTDVRSDELGGCPEAGAPHIGVEAPPDGDIETRGVVIPLPLGPPQKRPEPFFLLFRAVIRDGRLLVPRIPILDASPARIAA